MGNAEWGVSRVWSGECGVRGGEPGPPRVGGQYGAGAADLLLTPHSELSIPQPYHGSAERGVGSRERGMGSAKTGCLVQSRDRRSCFTPHSELRIPHSHHSHSIVDGGLELMS